MIVTLICYVVKSQPNTSDADPLFGVATSASRPLIHQAGNISRFHKDFPDYIRFNTCYGCFWDLGGVKRYKSLYTQACGHARILENVQNGTGDVDQASCAVATVDDHLDAEHACFLQHTFGIVLFTRGRFFRVFYLRGLVSETTGCCEPR